MVYTVMHRKTIGLTGIVYKTNLTCIIWTHNLLKLCIDNQFGQSVLHRKPI